LLDEIEKAHPEVFNILLQVLDDGRLTDNKGRAVNFKNTIIIMTSNIGSQYIQAQINSGNTDYDKIGNQVISELKSFMRPEFLNRIDEIVVFRQLDKKQITQIVKLQVSKLSQKLTNAGYTLEITDNAIDLIGRLSYDPNYGARPVKRFLQRELENKIAKLIISGDEIKKGIKVVAEEEELKIILT